MPEQEKPEDAARALEEAQMAVADTAAEFVDGDATIYDLRRAVGEWRKASQALHDAMVAEAQQPRNRRYTTIAHDDVGRALFDAFGRRWPVSGFIGRILPTDVGKRVYLVGDVLQVENDEQRATREGARR
jgi:hypothetical protein